MSGDDKKAKKNEAMRGAKKNIKSSRNDNVLVGEN